MCTFFLDNEYNTPQKTPRHPCPMAGARGTKTCRPQQAARNELAEASPTAHGHREEQ